MLFWLLIDLEKAFDSVFYSNLWKGMAEINWTILRLLKEYYTYNVIYLKIGNKLSEPIKFTEELRQGSSLSQILFNIYFEKTLDH